MLKYNEVTIRKYILLDGEPYEVLDSHVFRKQQRKPVNQVKLKNLITGKIKEVSFHQSENVHEADMGEKSIKYLYENKGEYWFCETEDPSKRFNLGEEVLGTAMKFIKTNSVLQSLIFGEDERIIGVKVPIKVSLLVKEAPPAVKGNTAQGATKVITLETGATVTAPLFINPGDTVEINTETGEYTGRV